MSISGICLSHLFWLPLPDKFELPVAQYPISSEQHNTDEQESIDNHAPDLEISEQFVNYGEYNSPGHGAAYAVSAAHV